MNLHFLMFLIYNLQILQPKKLIYNFDPSGLHSIMKIMAKYTIYI